MAQGRKIGSSNPRVGRKFGGWHGEKATRAHLRELTQRRQRGHRNPVTQSDLNAIIAAANVKITKLPPGFAFGATRGVLD